MDPIYYDFTIDFDKASELWRSNKKHIGCGHYQYVCGSVCKNVSIAKKKTECGFKCHLHKKTNKKSLI